MHILVVEDDPRIVLVLGEALGEAGYGVTVATDGLEGFHAARATAYDLVVLDLTLPSLDGIEVARRLRAAGRTMPILMLTARDRGRDKIAGLDGGADDYLTKPFRLGELGARVRALLRRDRPGRSGVVRIAGLEVDTATRTVRRDAAPVALSAREYALLEYLVHRAGQVVTRDQLATSVWNDVAIGSNVIAVYVRYLRRKIDTPGRVALIHTVRGVGYILRAP